MIDLDNRAPGDVETFKMDAGLRERWLTALRSEEYAGREAHSQLVDLYTEHYCALGLLAHIEGVDPRDDIGAYSWLEQKLPVGRVWRAFDAQEMTFTQFADWLEAHSEPVH